ncbi:MAG: hypothetical protein QXI27_04570 [Nitrososphaerota archaeon]
MRIGSREWSFVLMMSALGNVLAFITIAPTMIQQVALDFSLLPVYIAAIFGGPVIGGITGLLAGIVPSIWFGPLGSLGPLGVTASIGKAIVGITAGLLSRIIRPLSRSSLYYVPVVLLSYIPEALWIYVVFSTMVPMLLPGSPEFLYGLWLPILVKGVFEVSVMAAFMAALGGHEGFRSFVIKYGGKAASAT